MISKRKPKTKLLPKLYVIPFFLIIIYILFLLGRTVWQNYGVNKEITSLEKEISDLKEENKNLENLIQYYQSTTYKEQQARSKLGYQKPGEKVFIVPNREDKLEEENEPEENQSNLDSRPNYLKWWEYLFK